MCRSLWRTRAPPPPGSCGSPQVYCPERFGTRLAGPARGKDRRHRAGGAAHRACIGAGSWVTTPIRRRPRQDRPHHDTADDQPGPASGTSTGRTKHRATEVLADLPQSPLQSQPHDGHRRSRPHPGASTLKMLSDRLVRRIDERDRVPFELLGAPLSSTRRVASRTRAPGPRTGRSPAHRRSPVALHR